MNLSSLDNFKSRWDVFLYDIVFRLAVLLSSPFQTGTSHKCELPAWGAPVLQPSWTFSELLLTPWSLCLSTGASQKSSWLSGIVHTAYSPSQIAHKWGRWTGDITRLSTSTLGAREISPFREVLGQRDVLQMIADHLLRPDSCWLYEYYISELLQWTIFFKLSL